MFPESMTSPLPSPLVSRAANLPIVSADPPSCLFEEAPNRPSAGALPGPDRSITAQLGLPGGRYDLHPGP